VYNRKLPEYNDLKKGVEKDPKKDGAGARLASGESPKITIQES